MKNIFKILLLMLFTFLATASFSQRLDTTELYLGAKAGSVISTFNLDIEMQEKAKPKYGISAGIAYRYFNNKRVGLQLELSYIEKGGDNFFEKSKLTDTLGVEGNTYFTQSLKYIEFPFLMSIRMGKGNSKFRINLGPNISYLLSQKLKFKSNELKGGYKEKVDNIFEAGLNLGVAYSYKINDNVFDLEIRYMHGLTRIYKPITINNSATGQNQGVSISFVYFLKLKNKNHDKN